MFKRTTLISMITAGAVLAGATVITLPAATAMAAPSPVAARTATMPSAQAQPTVQIDGVAWSQEVVGNTVYVAGRFGNARPAGAAAGSNQTVRNNMLSYDITTGALNTSFNPNLNAQAYTVAASPDGSRIYVGGQFTTAGGQTRNRIAAYSTATGALITTFAPNLNSTVRAIAVTNNAVYVGGLFTTANGVSRQRLAAFNPANGALLSWNPNADRQVNDLVVTPNGSKVIAGGSFTTVGGVTRNGLAALDPTSGVPQEWAAGNVIYNHGANSAILSLDVDNNAVYGTGYVFGSVADGNLEGTFSANPDTGEINWIENCHGDHYDAWSGGGVVYTASHAHYCTPVGGFFQSDPWATNMRHAIAFSTAATGTNGRDEFAGGTYFNFEGTPSPTMYNWFPEFQPGTFTGQNQATWSVNGNTQYVVYGGEFTRVNGALQQGLVRFKVPGSPNELTNAPRLSGGNFTPSLVGTGVGTVRVAWKANWDRDDLSLTYRLVRNSQTAAPIYTTTTTSTFWDRPNMGFIDTGLTPGATYRYRLYVVDASGNSVAGDTVQIVAPSSDTSSAYDARVIADGASPYWSLGESSGSVAIDSAGFDDGSVGTGVVRGAAGSVIGSAGTASSFDGTANGVVTATSAIPGPNQFTVSAWFKTTTTAGGKIVGFGNSANGVSGNYDRHVYMDNGGRIWFGVYPGGVRTLNSSASYNDGQWHQVVASLGSDGMRLSIDGRTVGARSDTTFGQDYTGYWKVGGDNTDGWNNSPSSRYFSGDIDNVAFFPTVLSRATIRAQYVASGRSLGAASPADAYGADVYNDDPELYWRLGDAIGSTSAADSGPNGASGSIGNGVAFGVAGAIVGTTDTAASFNNSNGVVVGQTQYDNPSAYTVEAWIKTTTTTGGKIVGFGNSSNPNGLSSSYDRHVYMQGDGKIVFGTYTGQLNTATTTASYNDGQWHHVAASQGADGMKLYVDGTLVASNPQTQAQAYAGYWRIGGDNTWGSDQYFDGTIDEAAVFSKVLTAADIAQRVALGKGETMNIAPQAQFVAAAAGLEMAFDSSASADPDGTIAGYSWDFGDGATSNAANPTHTYGAFGTYQVTLTVTDDRTGTHSITKPVTLSNSLPTAAFGSTATNLQVAFTSSSTDDDGTIAGYAWDFGDGGTSAEAGPVHDYAAGGTYTVTLTVTDDQGATASTQQAITVTPANVGPTATFASSSSDLAASFDAGGSSDPDGSIVSYTWDFGDSAAGTGITAQHSYAAAGTYSVTLTVTDDDGATSSFTGSVTVTAPVGPATVATDGFGRTQATGLGTADLGGTWSLNGTASVFSVSSGTGRIRMANAAAGPSAFLNSVSAHDVDVAVDVSLDKVATGGGTFISLVGRRSGTSDYRAKLKYVAGNTLQLQIVRTVNGAETTLRTVNVPGITVAAGDVLRLRFEITGTTTATLNAKVWRASAAEPAAWQNTITDSTAQLDVAGGIGLVAYLSGSSTNAPVVASFDNLSASKLN